MREVGIPPDHIVNPELVFTSAETPTPWSIPKAVFEPIWNAGITGKGVRVCVCDTGCASHPNLPKPVASRNFTGGNQNDTTDRNGHGSHCAGTILGSNGIGVAPEAELLVAQVLSASGSGGTTGINAGEVWAAKEGADITSRSLGGGSPDQSDIDAINEAYSFGLGIDICAAGNGGYNGANTIGYPARYDLGICVGATQENGSIANFSSGGKQIDVATPGQNIISVNYRGGFIGMSGTSMATPFMAGLCALIIHKRRRIGLPDLKGHEAWLNWFKTEGFLQDAGSPGWDPRFGNGVPTITRILAYLSDPTWI